MTSAPKGSEIRLCVPISHGLRSFIQNYYFIRWALAEVPSLD